MDLGNPGHLISGMLISTIGLGLFIHGKKAPDLRNLGLGLAMMIFPIFMHSMLWLWLVAGACIAAVFLPRNAT